MLSPVFVFPGQGSQYVGMGKEIYQNFSQAKEVFDQASEALQLDMAKLCFEGPEAELNQTVNTQPALLTISTALTKILNAHGVYPQIVAGHSLGEYSALVCAEAVSFIDAVKLVRLRGQYMQEAAPPGTGGMAAILGLKGPEVHDICQQAVSSGEVVEAVNYNCPGQVVIAGTQSGLQKAMELAKEAGARRCVPLAVSGPFHSSLMRIAGERLAKALAEVTFNQLKMPLVSNVTADYVQTATEAKELLVRQVYGAVRWEESIEKIFSQGHKTFIEVGPGKVLSGLIKKTVKGAVILNVEDGPTLEKALAQLEEVG